MNTKKVLLYFSFVITASAVIHTQQIVLTAKDLPRVYTARALFELISQRGKYPGYFSQLSATTQQELIHNAQAGLALFIQKSTMNGGTYHSLGLI
jgi:hypothetical protein